MAFLKEKSIVGIVLLLFMMNSHVCFSTKKRRNFRSHKKTKHNSKMDPKKGGLPLEKGLLTRDQLRLRAQEFLKKIEYENFSQDESERLGTFLNDRITNATEILEETHEKDELYAELLQLSLHREQPMVQVINNMVIEPVIDKMMEDSITKNEVEESEIKFTSIAWSYSFDTWLNLSACNYAAVNCWTKKDKKNCSVDIWGCLIECFSGIKEIVSDEEFDRRLLNGFGREGLDKRHLVQSKLFARAILDEINKEKKDEKIM